ncbi:type II toxin-antitoxin system RelE family toxin [Candidatus Pyrohabitans sp.]
MEWKVIFTKDSYKQYQRLEKGYKKAVKWQILKVIEQKSADIRPVKGHKNIYRIRLGKYRAILSINFNKKEIYIMNIKKEAVFIKNFDFWATFPLWWCGVPHWQHQRHEGHRISIVVKSFFYLPEKVDFCSDKIYISGIILRGFIFR